jgi:hypothetical protein
MTVTHLGGAMGIPIGPQRSFVSRKDGPARVKGCDRALTRSHAGHDGRGPGPAGLDLAPPLPSRMR